ncbi:sulfatase [Haloferula rosea]|uniref:Sulfatase n=1 Tax=Haloferula rosea TaxID=490093 RepID=A0A934VGB6_9BACT|nr:sulfatase [Haloferula rosea]MBK1827867.1 sulfatase [Haloferula rosea]
MPCYKGVCSFCLVSVFVLPCRHVGPEEHHPDRISLPIMWPSFDLLRPALALIAAISCLPASEVTARPPNVLFISIDDLNDWIEPLGGHPQAKTPHLNRLAKEGVNFSRNYCPSPGCNPSRSAVMTGYHPTTSGMYSNYQDWRKAMPDAVTLGEYFRNHGYFSAGAGKIFHYTQVAPECWDDYYPSIEQPMPDFHYPKPGTTVSMPGFDGMYGDFDWAPIPLTDEETGDGKCVDWVSKQLARTHDKPFFLACGIYRPHLPWYVPRSYFDLYPLESVQLPKILKDDADDLGDRAHDIIARGGGYHEHVIEAGQWREAVQGYLASVTFADAMLGRLLDALEKSPHADNTIVVVWSDHGWQLGEKQHWRKFALWENVARCVMMIKVPPGTTALPEGSRAGGDCQRVTSLMDIYPTLVDLCSLPEKKDLDGNSLVPLLRDPAHPWDHPAITTYDHSEYSVRTERWRYIRYIDDSEELYDHTSDPEEWHNLAGMEQHAATKRRLAAMIPKSPAPLRSDTLIELQPHHIPPYQSKKDYQNRKKAKSTEP